MRVITIIILSALSFSPLWAVDFQVTSNQDAGPGSLRQAITDFNASSGTNTITFNFDSDVEIIFLNSNLPLITRQGTIIVSTQTHLIIDGTAGPYRIFGANSPVDVSIELPFSFLA